MITESKTPWQRFTSLLELDRKDIRQIFYYAIFAGLVALTLPLGIQAIINLIQGAQVSSSWVILVVLVTVGVAFQGILQLMQLRILENMQQKIFARASFEFTYRFPKIKLEELRNHYPPELANRFFDILTVQKGLSKILIDFPAAGLQIIFGLILLSFYHTFFILYGFLLIGLIYIVFTLTAKKGMDTSLKESKGKYKVAHWIQEVARSLISFKISSKTTLVLERNDKLTLDYINARESHFRILMIQFAQMIGFKILVTAGLLIIGGLLVLNQQMNIGQFVAAEIIILLVIGSVEKLIKGLESFYDVLTSLEKIGQVVDKELDNEDGVNPFDTTQTTLNVELDEIKFTSADGKEIIRSANLTIIEKDRILLLGATGSGKSTLFKIISGLIPPTNGVLYINDTSIRAISLEDFRTEIGVVLPEQLPFEGTILENITLGNANISQERLHWTLKNTGLLSFIKEQPKGIHTQIQSDGLHIPYKIAKRLVLARAIVTKPKLLLLKDALEDFETQEAKDIIDFLVAPERPWALFIASRSSLWDNKCNKTVELKDGVLITKSDTNA
ncbi:peptidase domain-containing ABC transporter [Aquimarina agarivorans]|uniref:peptidase domain-containing ABC transporter n=1 Tax=Aquimarina agarivorans TaxID=980584 RepID=UPI000248E5DA|nr:ATP-binding cassette domain-containing protein [Aquimarina agarivorans]